MKKLSILVALILCVTIGGVYATWTYPGTSVAEYKIPLTHQMAGVDFSGSAGVYEVTSNTLSYTIDQKDTGDYTPVMRLTGSVSFTFTAHDQISESALTAALTPTVTIYTEDLSSATYDDKAIFTVNSSFSLTLDKAMWTKSGDDDDVYTYTIQASELANAITLNDGFCLDTNDEYLAFQAAQMKAIFRLNVKAAAVVSGT
ncbi:MAG: hypothetical protein J6K03_01425 [Oscillospiraceae bacterium]|nr:hypothetical protein [Oscillospiraceae bacterium]